MDTTELATGIAGATSATVVSDLAARAAAAEAEPRPIDPNDAPVLLVREVDGDGASRPVLIDADAYADQPRFMRASRDVDTHDALIEYVRRHHDDATTTTWIDLRAKKVVSILDDHGKDQPQHARHTAKLDVRRTPEWAAWVDGQGMKTQRAFAERIEDGAPEIVEPTSAEMLELAQSFQATVGGKFKSGTRLQDGSSQLEVEHTVNAKAGKAGDLTIPDTFKIAVLPFEGITERVAVTARLRYNIDKDGGLTIGYTLVRIEEVERLAMGDIHGMLVDANIGPVFLGRP